MDAQALAHQAARHAVLPVLVLRGVFAFDREKAEAWLTVNVSGPTLTRARAWLTLTVGVRP